MTLSAQSLTTAAIAGRITDDAGRGVDLAEIVVTNRATGVSTRVRSRADGRYLVAGLEVGGPYSIAIRHLGSERQTRDSVFLNLGRQFDLDMQLERNPTTLPPVEITATRNRVFSRARMGTEALVDESTIHSMPIVNRDMYDLVRLVPQMSTWYGIAAAGASPRLNGIRIDGLSDQTVFGGVPAGSVLGGRSIPLEAVKEYQVLLSPFDVRHGNFAGAMINAVTRSGTNDLRGSAYIYGTNERFGPDVAFIRDARYEKALFGFTLGGPIIRDRLHFFVAPEFQRRLIPALGPYVGQDAASETPLPVDSDNIARFQRLLAAHSLHGGSAGAVTNRNPSSNVFVRFDAALPEWNSRVVLRGNFTRADSFVFARPTSSPNSNCPTTACFPLSSLSQQRWFEKRSFAAHVYTNFRDGASNELMLGRLVTPSAIGPATRQPLVLVTTPGTNGQPAVLQSGTHEISTADSTGNWLFEVTDNLTFPVGSHRLTVGATAQFLRVRRFDLRGAYGVWEFASLDSLEAGVASRYRLTRDFGTANVAVRGSHQAIYIGDDWSPTSRLSLALGLRADIAGMLGQPPYVARVDSLLDRRTDQVPARRITWSPRLGFNYDVARSGDRSMQLRGGIGMFMARPPLAWLWGPFAYFGEGAKTLRCGSLSTDAGPPPAFRADYRDPPSACANGQGFSTAPPTEIDLADPGLKLPQVLRVTLAVDRELPNGWIGSLEGLYSRSVRSLFFSSVNLAAPTAVDRHGRVMYGTIGTSGIATPARVSSQFGDVISISNQSKDHSLELTGELRKEFAGRGDIHFSFTHAYARDVQSQRVVRPVIVDNWRLSRTLTGRQDDLALGVSDFDQPFRIRASGTLLAPWRRWPTKFSFYYVAGSGLPYTYVAGGASRGDLNADGALGNDPIYIPRSAFDTSEIRFAGSAAEIAAQQATFERFVSDAPCLRRQRGQIMARNSCRSPWMNLSNLAVRQMLPGIGDHAAALELQVFNVLNVLNQQWGRVELPSGANPWVTTQLALLSQVGQTAGLTSQSQPIFRFDPAARRYSYQNVDSFYQIQLALRYEF